jgi:hypothetical protein
MPQTGEVVVKVSSKLTATQDLSQAQATISKIFAVPLTNGAGINQASNAWSDQRAILTATNEDLDLAGGSLVSALGTALTFTEIKAIIIHALATNTGSITVTRPATNGLPFLLAAGDGFTLAPGGVFAYVNPSDAGIAVTAGTGDLINIANASGATQSYQIIIIGVA